MEITPVKRRLSIVIAVVGFLGTGPRLLALDLGQVLTGFTVTSWKRGYDVSFGAIRALAQDAEGYLWLGTDAGLVRLDGFQFTAIASIGNVQLSRHGVSAIHAARDGALWVAFDADGGVYRIHKGQLQRHDSREIFGSVGTFAETSDGTIWAGDETGLLRFHNGRWARVATGDGGPQQRVYALHVTRMGMLLVGSAAGLFRQVDQRHFERIMTRSVVRGVTEDADGTVWVADPLRGFARADGRVVSGQRLVGRGSRVLRDSNGNLWIGTSGQGLWRVSGHERSSLRLERATVQTGLVSDGIRAILQDRDGNIWVGTQEGLNQLTPQTVMPLVDVGIVASISAASDEVVWAGTSEGVVRFAGVTLTSSGTQEVVPLKGVRTVHYAKDGQLWIAADHGVYRRIDGRVTPVLFPAPQPVHITSITSDARHLVWLTDAEQGVFRWSDGHVTRVPIPVDLRTVRIRFSYASGSGGLWLAFEDGRLGVLDQLGTFQMYGPRNGLMHSAIAAVYEDEGGRLWAAGSHGLSLFDGSRFITMGAASGLPAGQISSVLDDGEGFLWLGVLNSGFIRVERSEFVHAVNDRSHRIRYTRHETADGVAGVPIWRDSHNAVRASNGMLWFVTGRGLTVIDPTSKKLTRAQIGPPRIETVVAGERTFAPLAGLSIPPRTSRLLINYTALNLTFPDRVQFRYRLIGFDRDWVDAGRRRQAFYTNLSPQGYEFQVQATTQEGVWNTGTTRLIFAMEPTFYQTRLFYAASVLALIGILWSAWQLHLRKLRHDFSLVLAERSRLSQDMHDTLLQSMAGIAMQVGDVAGNVGRMPSKHTRYQLTAIRQRLEEHIREIRDSIWNLRTQNPGGDLIATLGAAARRATVNTSVRFDMSVVGEARACPPHIERELLHIVQEALTNSVRHAQATRVHIEACFERESLAVRISDDGCGFDARSEERPTGCHFGLTVMRERAEQLGGQFSIATANGAGTRIETIVPLSPA